MVIKGVSDAFSLNDADEETVDNQSTSHGNF